MEIAVYVPVHFPQYFLVCDSTDEISNATKSAPKEVLTGEARSSLPVVNDVQNVP